LDTKPETPDQPPFPAAVQPASTDDVQAPRADGATPAEPAVWHAALLLAAPAPIPQPPRGDPLAALKAMSDDELIALFS
jgi:hypothetical protein